MRSIAREAIAAGHAVLPAQQNKAAIERMTKIGILENGCLVDSLVSYRAVLSRPRKCNNIDIDSRWSIRLVLKERGWEPAQSTRAASLGNKLYNPLAPQEYFLLLKHHLARLSEYSEQYDFKHSQGKGYYDALLAWCRITPEPRLNWRTGWEGKAAFCE